MCSKPIFFKFIFCSKIALKGKTCSRLLKPQKVAPNAKSCSKVAEHNRDRPIRDTKNVSDFVQKHFVSATNVFQFAQTKKHHGQRCVRNNVSLFNRALTQTDFCLNKQRSRVFLDSLVMKDITILLSE